MHHFLFSLKACIHFQIVNCIYSKKRFPCLLNITQLQDLIRNRHKLVAICDLTCDLQGSIKIANQTKYFDSSFFMFCFVIIIKKFLVDHFKLIGITSFLDFPSLVITVFSHYLLGWFIRSWCISKWCDMLNFWQFSNIVVKMDIS